MPERDVITSGRSTYIFYFNYFIDCQTFTFEGNEETWARVRYFTECRFSGQPYRSTPQLKLQGLDLLIDTRGISQYLVFVHEHRDIIPDLTDPYGLFSYKVPGPKNSGILEGKLFVMKDNLYKALPRKDLSCQSVGNSDTKEPSYEGGIGKCIESKKSYFVSN